MNVATQPLVRHRLLVVDDHPLVRLGLRQWITQQPDLEVCGEADSKQTAWNAIARLKPDLVILDLRLQGDDGLELIKDLRSMVSDLRILVLTQSEEALFGGRALRAGAQGYITKDCTPEELLTAIRTVLADSIYTSNSLETLLLKKIYQPGLGDDQSEKLSDRELEVFELLGVGLGNRDIAARLNIGIKTVEKHRDNIKAKYGLKNNFQMLRVAMDWVNNRLSVPLRHASMPNQDSHPSQKIKLLPVCGVRAA